MNFSRFSYTVSGDGDGGQNIKDWFQMSAAGPSTAYLIPNTTANSYYYSNSSESYPPLNYMTQQQSAVFSPAGNLPTLPADPFAPKNIGADENKMASNFLESLDGEDPFGGEGMEVDDDNLDGVPPESVPILKPHMLTPLVTK